eukprot:4797846-Amphidinium_carterae.2
MAVPSGRGVIRTLPSNGINKGRLHLSSFTLTFRQRVLDSKPSIKRVKPARVDALGIVFLKTLHAGLPPEIWRRALHLGTSAWNSCHSGGRKSEPTLFQSIGLEIEPSNYCSVGREPPRVQNLKVLQMGSQFRRHKQVI